MAIDARHGMLPITFTVLAAAWLCGCGSENAAMAPEGGQALASIEVTPAVDTLTALGQSRQLAAIARDAQGDRIGGLTFAWSASDESIARVSETGVVTAVGNGDVRISATADGVTGDATLTVDQANAALAFLTGPSDAVAGEAIDPAIRLEVRDAGGNRVDDAEVAVTLSLADNPGGATLAGTPTVDVEGGIAVFGGLSLDKAAAGYTLSAVVGDLDPIVSAPFTVTPADPATLSFLTQPGTAEGQVPFDPAIEVAVEDEFGNRVTAATEVTVALSASPSGEALGGTTTVPTVDGVAAFDDLSLALPGDGFVLEASSGALTPVGSAEFSVRLTFVQVSAGSRHTCGVTVGDFAYCWGFNGGAQLGDGTTADRHTPAPVAGGFSFVRVSAGFRHTCGVTTDDIAYCWGDNSSGQLGDGTTGSKDTPTPVAGDFSFVRVSAGASHTCGLTTGDIAYCWGRNFRGQIGDGTTDDRHTPTPVAGGLSFVRVTTGFFHTCGITTSEDAYCWGFNGSGQLGNGTTDESHTPGRVEGDLSFANVSASRRHTCGVTTGDIAYCWGLNDDGELGDGTTDDRHTPAPVHSALGFAQVSAGVNHTCGITTGEIAYCWGLNLFGRLGDGTTDDRHTPTPVAGGFSFVQVSAADSHTCGITTGDIAYCWGVNSDGQLGDGTTDGRHTPTHVVQ